MNSVRRPLIDRFILTLDRGLRAAYGIPRGTGRTNPADLVSASSALSDSARSEAGRLMRVNLAGEVAAQGLYHGQACAARNSEVRSQLIQAGKEEGDHLRWCHLRLQELGVRPSAFNPIWYVGSVSIGAAIGILGDPYSLGFLEETERQVVKHINNHLKRIPENDQRSMHVLRQMRIDEARHGQAAREAGGRKPPLIIQFSMWLTSRMLTTGSYWF